MAPAASWRHAIAERCNRRTVQRLLDAKAEITEDLLVESGVVRRKLDGVRVLAKGEIKVKLKLSVTGASKAAVAAVEKAGGALTVTTASAAE